MGWKPDRILKAIVFWITYLFVFSWLPLVRVLMDGESYQWGTSHFGVVFSSAGFGPDAWLVVFKSALLGLLLFGALRGANRWFRGLLAVWSVAIAADVIHSAITDPGGFEFHGDTLGIHLNLGLPVVAVVLFFAGLALYWVVREARRNPPVRRPPWTAFNRTLFLFWGLLLPVQFVLRRFGEPHGTTDAIGVLLTIAQCPLLAAAFWPWRRA
ncbi:MAG: hypothetical protein R3266_01480 [Gemmatimonadota bacterium]|nr:hypothetical protein [Gemmatimonadota bacterium]